MFASSGWCWTSFTPSCRGCARSDPGAQVQARLDPRRDGRHVRTLADDVDAPREQVGRVLAVDLVLGRARERAVRRERPQRVVVLRGVDSGPVDARILLRVLHDPSAPYVL